MNPDSTETPADRRLRLTLLGGFAACGPDGAALRVAGAKGRALLAYLALQPDRTHLRDKLAALLWGEVPDDRARDSLRHALSRIRRAAATVPGLFLADGSAIGLASNAMAVDAFEFSRLARSTATGDLRAAVSLYHGDLLDGFGVDAAPFEDWLRTERERFRTDAVRACEALVQRLVTEGLADEAITAAQRLLAIDALQEATQRTLMTLYLRQGRRAEALRQYHLCVDVLRRELGAEPSEQTQRLYQDMSLPLIPQPPAVPAAPGQVALEPPVHPIVGRDEELRRARACLDAATRGRGARLAIRGEAGIGKSRLIAELTREARATGTTVVVTGCFDAEQSLPFSPWVTALRLLLREASHRPLAPAWIDELSRLLPELASPRGLPLADTEGYLRLFEAVRGLLTVTASVRPVILVFEDVHWADEMSRRLLSYVARRIGAAPLLLVTTARDDEHNASGDRVIDSPDDEIVRLGPLPRTDVARMIATLVPGAAISPTLEDAVWKASEGNPFVVSEFARAILVGDAVENALLPPRVRDLVLRRVSRLDADARAVLEIVAVEGGDCEFDVVQRALGLDRLAAAGAIERLTRERLLTAAADRLRFEHERVRMAVHDSIVGLRRGVMHSAIAEAIEATAPARTDVRERIAHHFISGDRHDKAAAGLTTLAQLAALRHAHDKAVHLLQEALGRAQHLPDDSRRPAIAAALPTLLRSLFALGRVHDAYSSMIAHVHLVEDLPPALMAPVLFWQGYLENLVGNHDAGMAALQRARGAAREAGDAITLGLSEYELARACFWVGRPAEGVDHAQAAIGLLEPTREQWWYGMAHWALGILHGVTGEFAAASKAVDRALEVGTSIDDAVLRAYALFTRAWVQTSSGDPAGGIASARAALDISPDPITASQSQAFLGFAHLRAGHAEDAIPHLTEAVAAAQQFKPGYAWFTVMLADANRMTGGVTEAREQYLRGLQLANESQFLLGAGLAMRGLGELDAAAEDLAAATQWWTRAAEVMSAVGARAEAEQTRALLRSASRALQRP